MATVIAFPGAEEMDTIDAAVIERLGWWYAPLLTFVYAAAVVALNFYQLDKGRPPRAPRGARSRRGGSRLSGCQGPSTRGNVEGP